MKKINQTILMALLFVIPHFGYCQDEVTEQTTTYFSNALFIALLVTIVFLAIMIVAFSAVFKNILESNFAKNKSATENTHNTMANKTIISALFVLLSSNLFSQESTSPVKANDWLIGGLDGFTFYFMVAIIFFEIVVLGLLIYQFQLFMQRHKKAKVSPFKKESKFVKSLVGAVDIENEDSILLDHDYDGIKELDNNLPPWWKYGFYLTIVVSVIYLINYHVLGTGDLQAKEYEIEIAKAKVEVEEYMKTSANNVDEFTVKLLTEQSDIDAGKDLFISNCAACHGQLGEGTVGPNFTDEYWMHGGSIQDIFKSIKYGWVEKGMKSWKEDLSPMQIAQVTSYIKLLKGTNPPNGKAPQGDLYNETAKIKDSTNVAADSLNVLPNDTITANKK